MKDRDARGTSLPAGDGRRPSPAGTGDAVVVMGLRKQYGGIRALNGMDLAVATGTIHAIVGENGAGKSTLMKILAGAVQPDAGTLAIHGRSIELDTPQAARRHGIGIVYQELSLFPERSILANLFAGQEPTRLGLVDRGAMVRQAAPVLDRIGLTADVDKPVGSLGIGERQLVELSRLLIERPHVVILDEPNSALNERETQQLFAILRELAADGITILYVSHRLEEVFVIADRITVMRNGQAVFTRDRAAVTIPEVVQAMIGASRHKLFPPRSRRAPLPGPPLVVTELVVEGALSGVSFEARPGEIIGLAGLEGSGIATLFGVLFGTVGATGGSVRFPDGKGLPDSPTAAARRRIGLVPADRRHDGLMLDASVARNIAHVAVGTLHGSGPWLHERELIIPALGQIGRLQIRAESPAVPVGELSGGNQQKVCVAKWLEIGPLVMLLDDPTRGVDIGAKHEIYLLIRKLSDEGRIVLFRSTELPELVGLADRILVFYRGRLTGEYRDGEVDDQGLLHAINTGDVSVTWPTAPARGETS